MIRPSTRWTSICLALLLMGSCAGRDPSPGDPSSRDNDSGAEHDLGGTEVVLVGRFHLIWNGEPRWFLALADGESIEVVRDDRLFERYGGAPAMVGKSLRVTGKVVSERPRRLRATTIEPVDEGPP